VLGMSALALKFRYRRSGAPPRRKDFAALVELRALYSRRVLGSR